MKTTNNNIELKKLKEYHFSKKLSALAWEILSTMNEENKELLGIPFVKATDSVGAHIVEGFNQSNIDDKIIYYTHSKAALSEAVHHWSVLMQKRNIISKITYNAIVEIERPLLARINNFLTSATQNEKL